MYDFSWLLVIRFPSLLWNVYSILFHGCFHPLNSWLTYFSYLNFLILLASNLCSVILVLISLNLPFYPLSFLLWCPFGFRTVPLFLYEQCLLSTAFTKKHFFYLKDKIVSPFLYSLNYSTTTGGDFAYEKSKDAYSLKKKFTMTLRRILKSRARTLLLAELNYNWI